MSDKPVTKPYRVLVGSYQQRDADGQLHEFSRGDRVSLTDEEVAARPDAFEPWRVDGGAPVASVADSALSAEVSELRQQNADLERRVAELEAAATAPTGDGKGASKGK